MNPRGQRLESSLPKDHEDHEDHIAGKGYHSMSHYICNTKTYSDTQARKILDAKAAVDKEWKNVETIQHGSRTKVKGEEEIILEAQWDKKKAHFATLMDICHLKKMRS